ncbi:MAG: vitamin K epoxide reductase family protein [Candidatus Taylorbacteria bacterium]
MKSPKNLNVLVALFSLFAFAGFIDASYLTVEHYLGTPIPCSVFGGCDIVTNSSYSQIGGVPLALVGALYYLSLIIFCIIYFDSRKTGTLKIASYIVVPAFLVSLWLVYLQFFVIHAICLYCMISATISLVLFVIGQITLSSLRNKSEIPILNT